MYTVVADLSATDCSWQRQRSTQELSAFIARRTRLLGECCE